MLRLLHTASIGLHTAWRRFRALPDGQQRWTTVSLFMIPMLALAHIAGSYPIERWGFPGAAVVLMMVAMLACTAHDLTRDKPAAPAPAARLHGPVQPSASPAPAHGAASGLSQRMSTSQRHALHDALRASTRIVARAHTDANIAALKAAARRTRWTRRPA